MTNSLQQRAAKSSNYVELASFALPRAAALLPRTLQRNRVRSRPAKQAGATNRAGLELDKCSAARGAVWRSRPALCEGRPRTEL